MHQVEIGFALDPGLKRKDIPNQDSLRVVTSAFFRSVAPLLIIADGMGGYNGGAIASKVVVDTIAHEYKKLHFKRLAGQEMLEKAVHRAHQVVTQRAKKDDRLAHMGSTVVAAIINGNHISLVNVGDSRAYLINEATVMQINWDHSLVADLVRQKKISNIEANHHPKRNVLTLSLSGLREKVIPYCTEQIFNPGDALVLCSDGLWTTIAESQLQTVVMEMPAQKAAKKLVELANRNQGPDNISVIIAKKKLA